MKRIWILALIFGLVPMALAQATDNKTEQKSGDDGKGITIKVKDPIAPDAIKDELKLSDAQYKAYTKHYNAKVTKDEALNKNDELDYKQKGEQRNQIKAVFLQDVKTVLTDAQYKKLLEIMAGPKDKDLMTRLKGQRFTEQQKQQMKQIQAKYKDQLMAIRNDRNLDEFTKKERQHVILKQILVEMKGMLDPKTQKDFISGLDSIMTKSDAKMEEDKRANEARQKNPLYTDPLYPSRVKGPLKFTDEQLARYTKLYDGRTEKDKAVDADTALTAKSVADKKAANRSEFIEAAKKLMTPEQVAGFEAIIKGPKVKVVPADK